MNPIILTTLGTGPYRQTTYQWGTREPVETKLISAALKVWLPNATVKVLMTAEAKEKNGSFLKELIPSFIPINISKGASDEENWEQFGAIVAAIPEGSTVYMDVTHGFRSLPIVTLLAIAYLRSVRSVTLAGVLYGAFEPDRPPEEITPVFDLTPFVSMLDWASATERFLETGDARKFKGLVSVRGASLMNNVGSELEKLSIELALHRSVEAMNTAMRVIEKIRQSANEALKPEHQPFNLLRDRIVSAVQPLSGMGSSPEIQSQFAQIMWYAQQKQYAQGISLAREWLVAVRIWVTDGWFSVSREEQEIAENWLNTMCKALKDKPEIIPPRWLAVVKMWDKIADQRNDYAHFGMRKSVISAKNTLKDAQAILDDLRSAVLPLGLNLEGKPKP